MKFCAAIITPMLALATWVNRIISICVASPKVPEVRTGGVIAGQNLDVLA